MAAAGPLPDLDDVSEFDEKDEVDSLPSLATSDIYSDADSEAQAEWDRSLKQLQLVLTMMIVPWVGKYFGRRFAFWSRVPPRPCFDGGLMTASAGWARYLEWVHKVEVRWTSKKTFRAAGVIETAATL